MRFPRYFLLSFLLLLSVAAIRAQELRNGKYNTPDYLIRSIYFGGGSNYIDSVQTSEIHRFMDSIPRLGNYVISIHSHTDNIGGRRYNEWLSARRSEAVTRMLTDHGVFPGIIKQKDFGQLNPLFDNNTWQGRQRNRRVDIIFWPTSL